MITHVGFTIMWLIVVFLPGNPMATVLATIAYLVYWVVELLPYYKEPEWKTLRRRNRSLCDFLERELKNATDPDYREVLENELAALRTVLLQRKIS